MIRNSKPHKLNISNTFRVKNLIKMKPQMQVSCVPS